MAELDQGYSTEPMDAVVILDDAIVSGDSMFKVYDLAEQRDAHQIFAYVLIKRGPDDLVRRFEKISEYGHSKIQGRYLADVEIPTYKAEDCPICDRLLQLESLSSEFPEDGPYNDFLGNEINRLSSLSVEVVALEEVITSTGPLNKVGQSLVFRWKLELAKRKMGMAPRKELDSITKNFVNDPSLTLCLFKVIAREQQIFLKNELTRRIIFYDTFAADIVVACRHFLRNIDSLTEEEFEAVVCLILFLDEDFRVDDVLEISRQTLRTHGKFFRLVTQIFFARIAYDYPGRTAKVFRTLSDEVRQDSTLGPFLSQVLRYWLKQEKELRETQNDRLAWFNELTGRLLHETGHLKDTIIFNLTHDFDNYESVNKSWVEFYEYLSTAMPLLRNFSENHVSAWLSQKLSTTIAAIEVQMTEAKKLIAVMDSPERKTAAQLREFKDILRRHVLRIFSFISESGGTHTLLEYFKTNIKSVVFQVMQQQDEDLKRCNLRIIREFPEESCVVFGEDTFIIQIFQNLIENVWKNTKATLLKLQLVSDDNDPERVNILFLDNGPGLTSSFTFGQGLKVVKRNARASCGDFEIKNLSETQEGYSEGFRTIAILTLPRL